MELTMDHMCTALNGTPCSVCDQRQREQDQFNELAQYKAAVTTLADQNDKLICNLVEIAANLGVPPNQVGYDATMQRVAAFKSLLKACQIFEETGDSDFIKRAMIPFASDPA